MRNSSFILLIIIGFFIFWMFLLPPPPVLVETNKVGVQYKQNGVNNLLYCDITGEFQVGEEITLQIHFSQNGESVEHVIEYEYHSITLILINQNNASIGVIRILRENIYNDLYSAEFFYRGLKVKLLAPTVDILKIKVFIEYIQPNVVSGLQKSLIIGVTSSSHYISPAISSDIISYNNSKVIFIDKLRNTAFSCIKDYGFFTSLGMFVLVIYFRNKNKNW